MSDDLPEFDLAGFLPYRLTVAAERLSAGMARRYRNEFGISIAEWRVLVHLVDAGEVSIRDLAATANLEKSKASRAASRLAQHGLIEKTVSKSDRRLLCLSLTGKGRALMRRLIPLALDYQARLDNFLGVRGRGLDAALDALAREDL